MYDDEKRHIPDYPRHSPPTMRRSTRPLVALLAVLLVGCYSLWRWEPAALHRGVADLAAFGRPEVTADKKLVPLEAHIMSKCPDAKVRREAMYLTPRRAVSADCDGGCLGLLEGDDFARHAEGPRQS